MQVDLKHTEEHFTDLASDVNNDRDVEIARAENPTSPIVATKPSLAEKTEQRILGAGSGELRVPSDEEWRELDKELEGAMLDDPLTTTGEI